MVSLPCVSSQWIKDHVDIFVGIRILGIMGLVWVLINMLHLSLVIAPSIGMRIEDIVNGSVQKKNDQYVVVLNTEARAIGRYFLFVIFIGLSNCTLVVASIVKRKWIVLLWISFEIVTLFWHFHFFSIGSPSKYSPTFVDTLTSLVNIATGAYLIMNFNVILGKGKS